MDYIVKKYVEACKEIFGPYGFIRKKNSFIRVKNDVLQNFKLEKIFSGRECRIVFAILPLCMGLEKDEVYGGVLSHELNRFEPVPWGQKNPWEIDPKSEASMDECIAVMKEQLTKYLIPLFEKADSCTNAYQELCELDRKIRPKNIYAGENYDKFFLNGVKMHDYSKYWIALKNRDYHSAVLHLDAIKQQNIDSYERNLEMGYLTDKDKLERKSTIEEWDRLIAVVSAPDETYIRQMIEVNEKSSIEIIKSILG